MALSRITNYIEADGADLNLQSSDTTITANSILGSINFKAPNEASGTDSILLASKIEAVAEGTFSASSNATSVIISTASSEAAGTAGGKFTFGSTGNLTIKDLRTADGSSPRIALETGDTDIAQDDVLGDITFQAPDEGTGTDAILAAAAIAAVSEGDFSSSSNATKLVFKTASSEAAAEKMSLSSGGDLKIVTDGASIFFGADSEIELRHVADDGLILKHVGTGDGKEPSFTFQAGDNDISQDDVLGSIFFQAPDEGTGTDAVLVAAGIQAVAEADFSSSVNSTKLQFKTGASAAASTKMELTSVGVLSIPADGSDLGGTTNAIHLGASADMKIFHNSGNNYILTDQATQSFTVLSDVVRFNTRDNGENLFGATLDAGFFAKFDNSTKFQCTTDGVQIDGDIVFGNSANGINLGVTSNTDSNTLDDYEEGTFTASANGFDGTFSSIQYEYYTKVGQQVFYGLRISGRSNTADNTQANFGGFPFSAYAEHPAAVGMNDSDFGHAMVNTAEILYFYNTTGGDFSYSTWPHTTGYARVQGSYRTA